MSVIYGRGKSGRAPARQTVLGAPPLRPAPESPEDRLWAIAMQAGIERQANEVLEAGEAGLDPRDAAGFASRIAGAFDELAARSLADLPADRRRGVASGLAAIRDAIAERAREYEALSGRVRDYNTATRMLDDIASAIHRDPSAYGAARDRGLAALDTAPIGAAAKAHLSNVFLADLPVRLAEAHIAHDPEGAARALQPGGGVDYDGLAVDVRARFAARAEAEAVRRRDESDRELVARLERAIDENRIGAVGIAGAGLDPERTRALLARLSERSAEETRRRDIVAGYLNRTDSYAPDSEDDHEKVALLYEGLGGTVQGLAAGDDDSADLVVEIAQRTGIIPDVALLVLDHLSRNGDEEQREFAETLLAAAANASLDGPVPEDGASPVQDEEADEVIRDEGAGAGSWRTVAGEVLDLLTDVIPVVSEVKAAGQVAHLAIELKKALELGDQDRAKSIGSQLGIAALGLAPGPNAAAIAAKLRRIVDLVPGAAKLAKAAWEGRKSKARFDKSKKRGARFEQIVFKGVSKIYAGKARTQITVLTKNGYRIRLDIAVRRRNGTIEFAEVKAGNARLSKNQREGFADLRANGGEIRGKGKEHFRGGTQLPPTRVREIYENRLPKRKGWKKWVSKRRR